MVALEYDALFAKSLVFVKRALAHRDANHLDEFQLWASLSLEIVGKAALAKIHPALVADPQNADSLFAACGRPLSASVKTITATTVFSRLKRLSRKFDDKTERFCLAMAERRNAELHSGEAPFAAFLPDAWLPKFWETCSTILEIQDRALDDWLGAAEADAARQIIGKAITALEHAVSARIGAANTAFAAKYSHEALTALTVIPWPFGRPALHGDFEEEHACPGCSLRGVLAYEFIAEELLDPEPYEGPTEEAVEEVWLDRVKVFYAAKQFACPACELQLNGQDELAAAKLPLDTDDIEEREPEWEPDYGNC